MTRSDRFAFCRLCLGYCGLKVTVDDGQAVKVIGDPENPVTHGFTCVKARSIPAQLRHPDRVLGAYRHEADGTFRQLPTEEAITEIADRFGTILHRHGPRSVALYTGTGSAGYPASSLGAAFWRAIGSPMTFSPSTIDQPGKQVAASLHGRWNGTGWSIADADVWTFIGANPVLTMWAGTPMYNPTRQLRLGRERGMRIIVIDPRRTELAAFADVHLRVRPGEDPTLLAGLIHLLLRTRRHDADFCSRHVDGLEDLAAAVERFEPAYVAERAGVDESQLHEAVDILTSTRRGGLSAGTGPNMAKHGVLSEYLLLCLNTLCGYWRREGDPIPNPGVLIPAKRYLAQVEPRTAAWGGGERMRVRNLEATSAGMPTAALPDEMLLPGEGQVKALVNLGGNPALAWPDQLKAIEALRELELLVSLDVRMSATSRLSHYVLGTKFHLEVPEVTMSDGIVGYGATCSAFPVPYAMHAPAIVEAPPGSDLIEEWELFFGMAQRLGFALELNGQSIDMSAKPTTDGLYDMLTAGSRIPLDDVRRHARGKVYAVQVVVEPAEGEGPRAAKLDLGSVEMRDELASVVTELRADAPESFPFRLISRRMVGMKNSFGRDVPGLAGTHPYNPAFMHPDDMTRVGVVSGGVVRIRSRRNGILAVAQPDDTVRPGCVSMTHCWGGLPEQDDAFMTLGSNTSRLVDNAEESDPITGMPLMSALPVSVEAASDPSYAAPAG